MSISLPTFLVMWFILTLNTPMGRKMDTSQFLLQGPVKSFTYSAKLKENQSSRDLMYDDIYLRFDKQGQLISYTRGEHKLDLKHTYYPSGRLMLRLHFDPDTLISQQDYLFYDKEGRLSHEYKVSKITGSTLYEYVYVQKYLHHVNVYRDYSWGKEQMFDIQDIRKHMEDKTIREVYHFNPEMQMIKVESGGKLDQVDDLKYDARGRLLSILGTMNIRLEYNQDAYPIAFSHEDEERSLQYTLDKYGNPTLITETTLEEGKPVTRYYHFNINYWK